jgi:cysteine synthase
MSAAATARVHLASILEAVGHTPLVRLRLDGVPTGVEVWGK